MKSKVEHQRSARELRSSGISLQKISDVLGVSKASLSVWVRDIILTETQKTQLNRRTTGAFGICKGCKKEFEKIGKQEEINTALLSVF